MTLLEPFSWTDSLAHSWPIIAQGVMVSISLGLIGCFLVVRGMALLGDALSHSVLPGIVAGFLLSAWLGAASLHSPWILVGATAAGMGAALLVQAVQEQSRVKQDASLGIVFTTLFALGVVMVNLFGGQSDLDPGCVLYGNIEYFTLFETGAIPSGLWPTLGVTILIVLLLVLFYRQILVSTFDAALATGMGIPARAIHYGMMAVLSLTIVTSFESVGAILPVALLILPGATARLWTDRMRVMLVLAAIHGIVSTLIGYWLGHHAIMDTSTGAAICVAGFVLLLASWIFAPVRGLVPRMRAQSRLQRQTAIENLLKAIEETPQGTRTTAGYLARVMHLPRRAIRRAVRSAESRGWVGQAVRGGAIALTAAGEARAKRLLQAHLLWEQYLQREVGLEADHVHDAAEWIEHYLNDEKLDRLDQTLGGTAKPAATNP